MAKLFLIIMYGFYMVYSLSLYLNQNTCIYRPTSNSSFNG